MTSVAAQRATQRSSSTITQPFLQFFRWPSRPLAQWLDTRCSIQPASLNASVLTYAAAPDKLTHHQEFRHEERCRLIGRDRVQWVVNPRR